MAEDGKQSTAKAKTKATNDKNDNAPTAQEDRAQLDAREPAIGRKVDVEVDPAEAEQNHADWLEGREPNDVVEVEGQRETVEARMARNGVNAPEKAVGATTKPTA